MTSKENNIKRKAFIKGWNAFMQILPNITKDECLLTKEEVIQELKESGLNEDEIFNSTKYFFNDEDKYFPYNRNYTNDKKRLVSYFSDALEQYRVDVDS